MNVNFTTHGAALQAAYEKVLDASQSINWALFGYDKATNDLKVLDTGEGGLEELEEEFNSGKIQYAFCRVLDGNTRLPKLVLISWCGDGVPVNRKALLPTHLADIRSRFRGFHVEIAARTEADVEPAVIVKKVRDSGGANYSHQQPDLPNHRKDIPDTPQASTTTSNNGKTAARPPPIKLSSKPAKWAPPSPEQQQMNAEEIRRQRLEQDRALMEKERWEYEEREKRYQKREETEAATHRNRSPSSASDGGSPTLAIKPTFNKDVFQKAPVSPRGNSAEEIRRRRTEEDQLLMAKERKLFQEREQKYHTELQHTQQQLQQERGRIAKLISEDEQIVREEKELAAERERLAQRQHELLQQKKLQKEQQEQLEREQAQLRAQQEAEDAERKRLREEKKRQMDLEMEELKKQEQREKELQEEHRKLKQMEEERLREEAQLMMSSMAIVEAAQVVFAYEAQEDNEMSLVEGEMVVDIVELDPGWWQGAVRDPSTGTVLKAGLFPANYVEKLATIVSVSGGGIGGIGGGVGESNAPKTGNRPETVPEEEEPAEQQQQQQQQQDNDQRKAPPADGTLHVRSLYDYEAQEENEISFAEGDWIVGVEKVTEDWWSGEAPDGRVGLFPANYVQQV